MLSKELLKKIKKLEVVTKKTVDSLLGGEYHSVFKGQGIHFADFREYYPGDDVRSIAWKLTARTGSVHVKTFEEERELNVFLLVDVSASQVFSSNDNRKIDLSSEISSVLAYSAILNKDRIGLLTFSDGVNEFIPPKKGKIHVLSLITRILQLKKLNKNSKIKEALEFISKVLKKKSVIFIISDFIYSEEFEKILKRLSVKHDIIALWIYDEKEYILPELGLINLKDPETGEEILVDTSNSSFRETYSKNIKAYKIGVEKVFKSSKVDFLKIKTSDDYVTALLSYFKLRKKRIKR